MKHANRMHRHPTGFTLVEVLVALLFLAMLLPALMQGYTLCVQAGSTARRRSEAISLAQSELVQLTQGITTGQSQTGNASGDFGSDYPGYQWTSTVQDWTDDDSGKNVQEVDVTVQWPDRNRQQSVTVSTLAYARMQ